MDKLTLQILPDSAVKGQDLYEGLFQQIGTGLHNSSLEWNQGRDYSEITVGRPGSRTNKKLKLEWIEAVSRVLADVLLDRMEEEQLLRLIRREKEVAAQDYQAMLGYCKQLMNEEDGLREPAQEPHGRQRRKKLLAQDLVHCLIETPVLNLEGFMRFRSSKYQKELREIIEYARDEFLMDQQYKEFIALLKYFVYIQDAKIPEASLIHKGGHEFMLLNDELEPIDTQDLDGNFRVEFVDKDFNFEDMIISTLITIAPERIYIHSRDAGLPVIKTILQIFEGRSELCEYCPVCASFLGERSQQDKLSP